MTEEEINEDLLLLNSGTPDYEDLWMKVVANIHLIRKGHFSPKKRIQLYWVIGKLLSPKHVASALSSKLIKKLAQDLRQAFPALKGFSEKNLRQMKSFAHIYFEHEKVWSFLAEIPWSHHQPILKKCRNELEREFYIRMVQHNKWKYQELQGYIRERTFQKVMHSLLPTDLEGKNMAPPSEISEWLPSVGTMVASEKIKRGYAL